MVTSEQVVWMYRLVLGREPENPAVIAHHSSSKTSDDLLRNFLQSDEFRERSSALRLIPSNARNHPLYRSPPREVKNSNAKRVELVRSTGLGGEATRLFDSRVAEGFWDRFVRPGVVVDIGYKGALNSTPIFRDAIGLDTDTPGYDGRNLPYADGSMGTIHASHLLEHVADYGHFFRECLRVLAVEGTLIIFVPLMDTYERRPTPPSSFNADHKRFYTAARLLLEIEASLPRATYALLHLRERFRVSDLSVPSHVHAEGPYEIECVLEKVAPTGVY
jgi:SAM-dependent methyltransferase